MDKEINKTNVTISLYFEVKDNNFFGGRGEPRYAKLEVGLAEVDLTRFDLPGYAGRLTRASAKILQIPRRNLRFISKYEYEKHVRED